MVGMVEMKKRFTEHGARHKVHGARQVMKVPKME
jgi:hypothetical protein